MAAQPEPESYVDFTFRPLPHPPSVPPMVVFTISGRKKYCNYVVEADGTTSYVEGIHASRFLERKCFNVPFSILFAPHPWARRASAIAASSDEHYFRVGTVAHAHLLRSLCEVVPAKADEAYLQGYNRLDVAIDVQIFIPHGVRYVVPPPVEVVVPAEMKLKELSEIGEGESCAICFEEFKDSKKKKKLAVTETPCSHLFHSDCLSPWLMTATTCPLCRSTLY
ncbi:hypothetical protein H6P81_017552 [Aristolochia fimbriata]|uniref:RING-type domain-containing protein n=1 Tax=Aristolochia fimbriata TaxID=158543 RepID=A0AAV7DYT0_ARIFI|nr:hypothetical protein H6P81_017552 [Aristolochia fimbriata]